jgi:ribosome biogenesis GTPase / thiamine phosphate phosphatase
MQAGRVLAGWDSDWQACFDQRARPDDVPARVARVDRGAVDLLGGCGPSRATFGGALLASIGDAPLSAPCAGDWVVLRQWTDGRVTVESVLPRRTAVVRARASGESRGQLLAANADSVLVTVSLAVEPDIARFERLVTIAWDSGAQPVLVLTKADLVVDAAYVAGDLTAAAPGVEAVVVSVVTGAGLDRLRALATHGHTLALVGQSGVGKSSLVNALAGEAATRVEPIGAAGKGRHTTVRRELVPVPGGGLLLDTPGLRGVGLLDVESGLSLTFPDIPGLRACR